MKFGGAVVIKTRTNMVANSPSTRTKRKMVTMRITKSRRRIQKFDAIAVKKLATP